MTRYIVDIDVDPQRRNDERAEPALEWVSSVFTAGGLRTVVDDAVVRLIGQGTRNRVLEVHVMPVDRDTLLAIVHDIDVEHGYRVPFDTDHVHKVERDAPPVTS